MTLLQNRENGSAKEDTKKRDSDPECKQTEQNADRAGYLDNHAGLPWLHYCMLLCLIFASLSMAAASYAATRYVDSSGSGCSTPSDTDYDAATRTCGSGSSIVYNTITAGENAMAASDTLLIRAGTYVEVITDPGKNGTSGAYTVIAGYPGETVTIRPSSGNAIIVFNASTNSANVRRFVELRNLVLDGTNTQIVVNIHEPNPGEITPDHLRFVDNDFSGGTQSCVYSEGDSHEWYSNSFHDCGDADAQEENGIYTHSTNEKVKWNDFYNLDGYGIQNYCNSGCSSTSNYEYAYNTFRDSLRGILINKDQGGTIYNNEFYRLTAHGIKLSRWAKLYNNVFYNNGTGIWIANTNTSQVVANNVSVGNSVDIDNDSGGNATLTNNKTGSATGLFIDAANDNFSPVESSVLIDAGSQISGFSSGRFCGSNPDQGSREAPIRLSAVVEDATPTIYSITHCMPSQSVRDGVGLKTPTVGNYAVVVASSGATENSAAISGTGRVDITLNAAVTVGQSLTDAMTRSSAPTLTDNVGIGCGRLNARCQNAHVRTYSAASGTNNVDSAGGVVFTAIHYRCLSWYADTSPISTDWLRVEDASNSTLPCPLRAGGLGAVAIAIDGTGADPDPTAFEWYGNNNGGAYAALTNTASATALAFANINAPALSDGQAISATILTDPHTSFVAGAVIGQQSSQPTVDLSEDSTTNVILLIKSDAAASVGDTFCIQPALAGGDPTSITQTKTPCFEITNPSAGM